MSNNLQFPQVTPNEYAANENSIKFVEYGKMPQSSYDAFKQFNFDLIEDSKGQPLMDSFDSLVEAFDNYNPDSNLIRSFAEYINSHILPVSYKFIATIWPPLIPVTSVDHDFILFFILKLLCTVSNPIVIIDWLSSSVFPSSYTRPQQNNFIAITKCKSKKQAGYWAVLTSEKTFILYCFKGNDATQVTKSQMDKIELEKDNVTINVISNGKTVASFVPEDPSQIQLWANIMTLSVPFPLQIVAFGLPTVDEFYQTFFESMVNADAFVLRALLSPGVLNPESATSKNIIKRAFDIFAYGNKAYTCICTTFLSDIMNLQEQDIAPFLEKPSNSKNLLEAIIKQYASSYIDKFIKRLTEYIDNCGGCGIGTPDVNYPAAEKLIVNTIKFICYSFNIVPKEIKQILNIFRTYIATKTNNKETIYKAISEVFLKDFICKLLSTIKNYVETVKNAEIYVPISRLLYVIFSHGKLENEFEPLVGLQKRLNKRLYKLIYEFALEISESESEVSFKGRGGNDLARGIEEIATFISGSSDKFAEAYNKVTQYKGYSVLGTNVSGILINYFSHAGDSEAPIYVENERNIPEGEERKRKEPEEEEEEEEKEIELTEKQSPPSKRHKYVRADQIEDLTGKVVKKIIKIDPNQERDPNKKYYKRVRKNMQNL